MKSRDIAIICLTIVAPVILGVGLLSFGMGHKQGYLDGQDSILTQEGEGVSKLMKSLPVCEWTGFVADRYHCGDEQ